MGRQGQRFAQRFHLVGVDPNSGAKWSLKQGRIGGRDAVPPQRVQERRELARRVETPGREIPPPLFLQDLAVEFVVPEHVQGLALVVVVRTGQPDQRGLSRNARGNDFLDEPTPRAHLD